MKAKARKAVVPQSKCGPRCSNQGGNHWCPPSALGSCGVFKEYCMSGVYAAVDSKVRR